MGNRSSSPRGFSSFQSSPFGDYRHSRTPHNTPHNQHWTPEHAPAVPALPLDSKFSRIDDDYETLEQVTAALNCAGLESSNLIVGVDFTKSNEWTGAKSFNRKCLHHIGDDQNPYEQAIAIIGKTLSDFDEDNKIPCFGFGDASTRDQRVFSFHPKGRFCEGFEEVLRRYRELVPLLKLSGPTSFAPVIETAMDIVEESGGQYHVLLIIADGQVTRNHAATGQLSPQEKKTIDAIVRASAYPLSIILVGVGDGPWDMMRKFDDNIPTRAFDNFQFANFTEIMSKNVDCARKEAEFALSSLMEIPSQYQATIELGILGHKTGDAPGRAALEPPVYERVSSSSSGFSPHDSRSSKKRAPSYPACESASLTTLSSSSNDTSNSEACPICLSSSKDMAFGCGHQACSECGINLNLCPICRSRIRTRIKLYS